MTSAKCRPVQPLLIVICTSRVGLIEDYARAKDVPLTIANFYYALMTENSVRIEHISSKQYQFIQYLSKHFLMHEFTIAPSILRTVRVSCPSASLRV